MKDLIKRSYQAVKNRGLINEKTSYADFISKIQEEFFEVKELHNLHYHFKKGIISEILDKEKYIEELTDLATVCIMQIHHLGYDFEKEFEKVVLKNEKRAKEKR